MSETAKPVRLQRSRKRGARLVSPNGLPVVCVTRPGKYGNPFKVSYGLTPEECVALYRKWMTGEIDEGAVLMMPNREMVEVPERPPLEPLRGCNVACACGLDKPCHADVVLELSNA